MAMKCQPITMRENKLLVELVLRFILFIVFTITDDAVPYHRALQPEELWLYRYPQTPDFYPGKLMWITVFSVPTVVFVGFYLLRRDGEDLIQAALGFIVNINNLPDGENFRPRPDFLSRCYPDGPPDRVLIKDTITCPGDEEVVLQGLKSFPSGHASLSFSSLGFVALYIAGKLQVFNRGKGQGWRFISFITPLVWALMIAVSRTSDYHHHWQDVTVGSIIGLVVCYTCYRQVYPSLQKANSHMCYSQIPPVIDSHDTFRPECVTPVSPHPKSQEAEFTFVSKII